MSRWTHAQCERCWISAESTPRPDGQTEVRRPHLMLEPEAETCCYCGSLTIVGIYRRESPWGLRHCPGHDD